MSRKEPIQVVGGAYSDDALPWTAQDCVNYIPVFAEKDGTRSPKMLRGAPGHSVFTADCGSEPVRGLHDCEGLRIAVVGTTAYSIASDGSATSLGTIPGVERVTIAHNQITGGHEIAFGNGQSGYVYNTADGTFGQITDEAFPGFRSVDFIDQYIIGVEPFGRYWFHSDLSAATSYSSIDRMQAEKQPDGIQQAIATGGDVFVLGKRSAQFFSNTGAATGTFANRPGTEMDVGAASPWTACRLDNSVYWLSNEGIVYRLEGYQPRRVSTHALEQAFSRADISKAFAFTFEDRGHKVYYLTVGGRTWGYDVATGEWHRRKSSGLDFWRMNNLVRWGRRWFGGDYTNGKLYLLDWSLQDEAGEELERSRICPVIHDHQNALIVNMVELVFDSGMDSTSLESVLADLSIAGDLTGGQVGNADSGSYTSAGGALPHSFSVLSGTFPPGLTLASDGSWSGTFSQSGTFSWTVRVTDAGGNTADLADTADVTPMTWLLLKTGGTGAGPLKVSPDGDDWTPAWEAVPLTGGTSWGPTGIGSISHNAGRVFGVSASAAGGADAHAFRGDDEIWRKATLNAGTGSFQTLWSGTHWWVAKHSGGSCEVSTDGITFTATGVVAHTIANVASGKVLTAYASGAALGRIEFKLRNADGTDSGVTVPNFDGSYVRGDARMASDGTNVCIAVRRGSVAPFSSHILGSGDSGQTVTDYGSPFPTFATTPDAANRHVHYSAGLGMWFVFEQTRVAMGATIPAIALDPVVFPNGVRGVADDGEKLICCGESGMLYKWTEADGWEALSSGTTANLMDLTPVSDWP